MSSKSTFSNSTSYSYAAALYELSKESSELDRVEVGMKSLNKLLNESPNFKNMILNPTVKKELLLRKEKKLPPFYRLISLIISGKNELLIMKFALNLKSKLPKINEVNVMGPVLAPITKLRKRYRCRILIRYPKNLFIQKYLSQSLNRIKNVSGIKLEVDVDPVNFS